jgi:hypothetical protein
MHASARDVESDLGMHGWRLVLLQPVQCHDDMMIVCESCKAERVCTVRACSKVLGKEWCLECCQACCI